MFFNGFKSTRELFMHPFSLPQSFSLDNHIKAWQKASLGTAFINSIVVSGSGILGVLITSSMLAYVLSRYRFPLRRFIYTYIILGLALPARLAIIPIFLMLNEMKLTDSRIGLILVYIATGASFATFLLKNFMDGIPLEIEESARIDGASPWTVYRKIALPLIKPALVVVGLVNFVNIWNDFFFPFIIITSKAKETVPLAVSLFYGEYSNQWPMIAAALTISVLPIMLIFFIFSKHFISGITQGAIK
jgi:raffinose/stachyose/melibiose transport system permease protein